MRPARGDASTEALLPRVAAGAVVPSVLGYPDARKSAGTVSDRGVRRLRARTGAGRDRLMVRRSEPPPALSDRVPPLICGMMRPQCLARFRGGDLSASALLMHNPGYAISWFPCSSSSRPSQKCVTHCPADCRSPLTSGTQIAVTSAIRLRGYGPRPQRRPKKHLIAVTKTAPPPTRTLVHISVISADLPAPMPSARWPVLSGRMADCCRAFRRAGQDWQMALMAPGRHARRAPSHGHPRLPSCFDSSGSAGGMAAWRSRAARRLR